MCQANYIPLSTYHSTEQHQCIRHRTDTSRCISGVIDRY